MSEEKPQSSLNTRYLKMPLAETPAVPRSTGPLDAGLPWVIELRVVGTASTIQTQVQDNMLIGRSDSQLKMVPQIDLTRFNAFNYGVSRRHAMITVRSERLFLKDLGSTNGTRLNGQLCQAHEEYRLRHGDEIMFGQLKLQLLFTVVPVSDARRSTSEAAPPALDIPLVGKGQHILIIEDDSEAGTVFRTALEQAGFTVTLVNNVAKALSVIFKQMPDAIIIDLMLPDMNGLDLLRFVRRQSTARRVPMIAISGATGGYQMNQALQAGADLFLGKPVAVEELVRALSTVMVLAR
jgi:CheY-like chemotaxis protein